MNSITRRSAVAGIGAVALTLAHSRKALAAKNYDIGVTDTEIKLGTTSPYSGPASAYGVYGQAQTAYLQPPQKGSPSANGSAAPGDLGDRLISFAHAPARHERDVVRHETGTPAARFAP